MFLTLGMTVTYKGKRSFHIFKNLPLERSTAASLVPCVESAKSLSKNTKASPVPTRWSRKKPPFPLLNQRAVIHGQVQAKTLVAHFYSTFSMFGLRIQLICSPELIRIVPFFLSSMGTLQQHRAFYLSMSFRAFWSSFFFWRRRTILPSLPVSTGSIFFLLLVFHVTRFLHPSIVVC